MSVSEKDFIPAQPWEQKFGKSVDDRVQWLGKDNAVYREDVRFPPIQKEKMQMHSFFIHKLGADVLQTMRVDEEGYQRERASMMKRQQAVAKIIRKKVKVADLDDGGISISIEQDWDTSSWNDSQVEAACEALLFIFYDLSGSSSLERKERAVMMLQKLIQRHGAAEVFLRKNLEMLVGKGASKLIRNGVSGSVLNLLFVINSCKERYVMELSSFSFNARAMEMLIQEARFAATLIQHTFRCQISKRRLKEQKFEMPGFDSDTEVYYRQLRVINSRSAELRHFWRAMHNHLPIKLREMIGGMRGPIHVGATYLDLCLDIVRFLVADRALKMAQGNREDIVRSGGCIILSSFIGCAGGKFSFQSVTILSEVSKVAESFFEILQSGVLTSTVKFLRYMRTVFGVGTAIIKSKKGEKIPIIQAYIAAMDIIINTVLHSAGVYRAREKFGYKKKPQNGVEGIDYTQVLVNISKSKYAEIQQLIPLICSNDMLKELSTITQHTQQPTVLSKAMFCILCLLSSDCHKKTMLEITAVSGILMLRLLALTHHEDEKTGMLALCILIQLCAEASDRHALGLVNIHWHLIPMNQLTNSGGQSQTVSRNSRRSGNPLYSNLAIRRTLFLSTALCRQGDWKYHEPEILFENALKDSGEWTRMSINLDILQTIKNRNYDGIGIGGSKAVDRSSCTTNPWTIPDLVILPTDDDREMAFSKQASSLNAKELCEFLVHPDEEFYYEALPLDEAVGICVIVESMSCFALTAKTIFSSGLIRFLSKFLYLCKYLFLGKPMINRQVLVILNGVKAAQRGLARLCLGIVGNKEKAIQCFEVIKATELLNTSLYFLNTLNDFNHYLDPDTLYMQKQVGLSSLEFFTNCTILMNDLNAMEASESLPSKSQIQYLPRTNLEELFEPAKSVVKLLMKLRKLYMERTDANVIEFKRIHDHMCKFIVEISKSRSGAYSAVQEWDLQPTLRYYLPAPLSGIDLIPYSNLGSGYSKIGETYLHHGGSTLFDEFSSSLENFTKKEPASEVVVGFVYRLELMELPQSFFEICCNMCAIEEGVAFCFMDGFLRRALDRMTILHYQLRQCRNGSGTIHPNFHWETKKGDLCCCLKLIKCTANHTQQRNGAANDLILNELFDTVGICKDLVTMKTKRDEEFFLLAYEVLAALARDTFRIYRVFEKHDIFEVVRKEMSVLYSVPPRGAEAMLDIINYSCVGITSDYIVKMIPKLREPLIKVARIYSHLDDKMRKTNWTLTKSAMLYRNSVDPNYSVEETVGAEIEEFVRTGSTSQWFQKNPTTTTGEIQGATDIHSNSSCCTTESSSIVEPARVVSAVDTVQLSVKKKKKVKDLTDEELLKDETISNKTVDVKSGTYSYCGISNCGSLRFPDETHDHGLFSNVSDQDALKLSLKLDGIATDSHTMPVSKLSAREKGLKEMIEYRKGKEGLSEIKKITVHSAPKVSSTLSPLMKKSKSEKFRKDVNAASKPGETSIQEVHNKQHNMVSISLADFPDLIMTRPPKMM